MQAIELATWAPNGRNEQNWRFCIIVNRGILKTIADSVQKSADETASWAEAKQLLDSGSKRASFFRIAPAAIAVAAAQNQSPVDQVLAARENSDPRAAQMRKWRNMADSRIQSVAPAIAYLLLVLHQMGLGAVWTTGPTQAKEELERILRVSPGIDIVAFVPVGYPAESPSPKERRPVAEVCEVIR